ncbi:MAG: M23 family metallopeptidase [Oscillospiraceae bacterium]
MKVRHADGYTTLYGHCSKLRSCAPGRRSRREQEIALVGATGKATGPHLHFELMHDGYYCNPGFTSAAV